MRKLILILLALLSIGSSYGQRFMKDDVKFTYELGIGGVYNQSDYFVHGSTDFDSLVMTGELMTFNFHFNIEASLPFASLYIGSGLVADNDIYTNTVLYYFPLKIGLRIYPIPRWLYVYGDAGVLWGNRIGRPELYYSANGAGIHYGLGLGVRIFNIVSVQVGYERNQYTIRPDDVLKGMHGFSINVSVLLDFTK